MALLSDTFMWNIRYGSYPVKGKYCHEMALRILLASIEVRYVNWFIGIMLCMCMIYLHKTGHF